MAKINKFNESQVEDNFFKIINTWEKLAKQENGNRYTRQVSNLKGKRPDSISDVCLKSDEMPMQLIAEVKVDNDNKTKSLAKAQLKDYMLETLKTGIKPFGVNVFGLSKTEIEIACFYLDEEEEIQYIDKKNTNDSILDYLNYALDVIINKTKVNKNNSIHHIVELEIKSKIGILHEGVRNHAGIAASDKIDLLTACIMSIQCIDFRNNLVNRKIKDIDFSRYIYNAIIQTIAYHKIEVQENVKRSISRFDQSRLSINNSATVPYKQYMSNYSETGIDTMSLPKFICSFILHEILIPLENKYKDKKIDISSILYNEFLRYTKSDGKDCGVVLTPYHITRLMNHIVVNNAQDVILDLCTGTGAFPVETFNRKKSLCQTKEDEEKLQEGYIAVELLQHMYFLAFANFSFNNISTDNLIYGDCYEVGDKIKKTQPTAGILNPPYSMMKGTKNKKMHEWSFVIETIKYLPKGAKMAAIVPMSCGLNDNKIVSELRNEILKNNRLDMIIKVADNLFQPSAAVNTSIFVFTVGETVTTNHQVFCVDYSDDGFYVSDNIRKPTENVQKLYDEIIDIIDNRKITNKSNFRKIGNDDWCYLPKDDIGNDLKKELEIIVLSQINANL
jgi:hypothetical protein